ncbi:TonB-dependent receptor [Labilibacter sediminis]|nr:TonB-dependent receptor [Labilibacter sediminis]
MKKVLLALLVLLVVGLQSVVAQTRYISGIVTDAVDGTSIPGVSILVKGTNQGTITDIDGRYNISLPHLDNTLVFTFMGMATQEIRVDNQEIINVSMKTDAIGVEEVTVVAYGAVTREARTGSVSSINSDEIMDIPVTSAEKALAGKMAGVMVTSNSGQPGAETSIRVRGSSSIHAGNEPLYVVDGIPFESGNHSFFTNTGNALASINPNDIESITVLKDAAAASVYGSRAANGVILITTKSGAEGDSKYSVRAKFGVSQLANDNKYGVMTGEELLSFQRTAAINAGENPDDPTSTYYRPMSLLEGPQTDWVDHLSRIGKSSEYELTAQGGSKKTKLYTSIGYSRSEGVYYGVDFSKLISRLNVEHKLSQKLTLSSRINGSYSETNDVPMQSLYFGNPSFAGMTIQPWTMAFDASGNHNTDIPENSNINPRATAEYDDRWEKQYKLLGNLSLEWKPLKALTLKTTNGVDLTFGNGRSYWSPEANPTEGGTLQTSKSNLLTLTTSNTAEFKKVLNDNSIRILAGQEAMRSTYSLLYLYSPDVDPLVPYPNTASPIDDSGYYEESAETLMSFFSIADYNFKGKYYAQASVRYDGSSKFSQPWGLFYAFATSWNMHEERFLKEVAAINLLKLRVSYGVNGNNNVPLYMQYATYDSGTSNGGSAWLPSNLANDNLSWELNKTWNVGVDFGLLNRFSGNIEVYKRMTDEMLFDKSLSATSGFSSQWVNMGQLTNTGLEFQLNANIIHKGQWKWDAGFNIAFNRSEIISLGDKTREEYIPAPELFHIVGQPLLSFYIKDYYGVNPINGEALYRSENGALTNKYSEAVSVNAGSPEPKFTGGINTSLAWKGFSLNAFCEFKGGNYVLISDNIFLHADGSEMNLNQAKSALNHWKKPGDTQVHPKPVAGNSSFSNSSYSTRFLERGDYFRIKDVTLSYNLPNHFVTKAGLSSLRLYVSGMNLYTFHDVDFWDPERGVDGMGSGIYPMTKTLVGGIELSF